jgi:hypothetical protein
VKTRPKGKKGVKIRYVKSLLVRSIAQEMRSSAPAIV